MAVVIPVNKLKSASIHKRFGRPNGYGQAVFGYSYYGLYDDICGIYQMRPRKGGRICVKEKFYWPTQKTSGPQEQARTVFKGAIGTWQALSDEQKEAYRKENPHRNMSGYNYYIKKYFEYYW